MTRVIEAILFDKDGTLFDFHATWSSWAEAVIENLAAGSEATRQALAKEVRFDLDAGRFASDSPVIAGTHLEAATCLARALPGRTPEALAAELIDSAARAPLVEAAPLKELLGDLSARGLALGVMTNDSAAVAEAHLATAGIREMFAFVAGYDSGFGAKPDPAPLLAFADAVAIAPERILMVGDSTHDLHAGRAAGMKTAGVLTGPAGEAELAPHADIVLPSIAALPDALDVFAKS